MSIENPIISQEETRLFDIRQALTNYAVDRLAKLSAYHLEIKELKQQRLASVNWTEKNRLTEKIRDKEVYNPAKYMPEFTQGHTPYFASFNIEDEDSKIGRAEYALGKQNLFKGNKVVIVDWRQAAISALYYEYEPGEDYDEEINGRDRVGVLTRKRKYTIKGNELLRIECSEDGVFEKYDDQWQQDGKSQSSSEIKSDKGDHHLVDILSLITPDQFRMITREYHGCLKLLGSAGAGKTTIALHRLSFLLFNFPEKFRPQRCLILMFNRALRDYVAATVQDLVSVETPVETFHSWAINALRVLGLKKISLSDKIPSRFDLIKKCSAMAGLVAEYADSAEDAVVYKHLSRMYSSEELVKKYLAADFSAELLKKFVSYYKSQCEANEKKTTIGFADIGLILRLLQLRMLKKNPGTVNLAMNYYDHLVIDEAQDLSQIEMECLLHATSEERSLTICADPNQQISQTIDASVLENIQLHLQKNGMSAENLQVSYRSSAEIMAVANAILDKRSVEETARHGVPVAFGKYNSWDEAALELRKRVMWEQEISPNGLIAVICKFKNDIAKLYSYLRDIPGVRKETQRFQPGIFLTNAHQVKGLEFTSVLVWNASAKSYHVNNPIDRNLLYVVLSRACDRLSIFCHEQPTEYLKKFF